MAARGRRQARRAARRGPLEGLPLGIKDLFCTQGVRTTAGSKILENFTAALRIGRDATTSGATAP